MSPAAGRYCRRGQEVPARLPCLSHCAGRPDAAAHHQRHERVGCGYCRRFGWIWRRGSHSCHFRAKHGPPDYSALPARHGTAILQLLDGGGDQCGFFCLPPVWLPQHDVSGARVVSRCLFRRSWLCANGFLLFASPLPRRRRACVNATGSMSVRTMYAWHPWLAQ